MRMLTMYVLVVKNKIYILPIFKHLIIVFEILLSTLLKISRNMPDVLEINLDVQRCKQEDVKIEFQENSIVVTTRKVKNIDIYCIYINIIRNISCRLKKEIIPSLQENFPSGSIP